MTEFNFLNPDTINKTGFHGWLNTKNKDVLFCARCDHLAMLERGALGFDGGVVYDDPMDGGPTPQQRSRGWTGLRQFVAEKHDWVHFVTTDSGFTLEAVVVNDAQREIVKEFAREAGLDPHFKGGM